MNRFSVQLHSVAIQPPLMQIPGLLKVGGVPLGRFNSGGIMGRIINKLHTKNCEIPAH